MIAGRLSAKIKVAIGADGMVGWDRYGNHYTAKDRDLDEKRGKAQRGCCPVCDRRAPCRFHDLKQERLLSPPNLRLVPSESNEGQHDAGTRLHVFMSDQDADRLVRDGFMTRIGDWEFSLTKKGRDRYGPMLPTLADNPDMVVLECG